RATSLPDGGGDVSRTGRRDWSCRGSVPQPSPSLHPGPARGDAFHGPDRRASAAGVGGRTAQPGAAIRRLSVSPTLSARYGCLPAKPAAGATRPRIGRGLVPLVG